MKIVIQRVSQAQVAVEGRVVAEIKKGAVLLVCMEKGDESIDLEKVSSKISALRYFQDPSTGKMNLDISQVGGEFLCVSQFTLSWNGQKGNRPSFDHSMEPKLAQEFFDNFVEKLNEKILCQKGVFGADMKVSLINDGPVTFSLNF